MRQGLWAAGLGLAGLLIGAACGERGATSAVATSAAARTAQTPRQRLELAVAVSRELAGKDEEPNAPHVKMVPAERFPDGQECRRFPRESQVSRYLQIRPWSWPHTSWHDRAISPISPEQWPSLDDAGALRELLDDKDPAMRAVAAEALATLHQPADVPRLARLLSDHHAASPFLGHNRVAESVALRSGVEGPAGAPVADPLNLSRSWQEETVGHCAQRAIFMLTGRRFVDEAGVTSWWSTNSDARNCLWYWQERLERELNEADIAAGYAHNPQRPDETWERWRARCQALRTAARAEVHKVIAAELRRLSPEVEAKVRLLATSTQAGDRPLTSSEEQSWAGPPDLRLSADRLLDLLDRKGLWPDVPWGDEQDRGGPYGLMVERMGMWAEVLFRAPHAARLQAVLKREHEHLAWSSQAAMIIGISRLLPPAPAGRLDDVDTRDGFLRQAILEEPELFTRGYCARELVCVGLPANAAFLRQLSFTTSRDDEENKLTQNILQALYAPPLTSEKREFLVELLSDQQFEVFWTRPNTRMGMDMCREYAVWAVNAYAGRELINDSLAHALVGSTPSAAALGEVRRLIAQLGQMPVARPGN